MKRFLILLASLTATACVQTTPRWDAQFGNAVRAAIASQTIDPGAAANRDPVLGADSTAALGAQRRYEQSYAQPESKAPTFLINTAGQ